MRFMKYLYSTEVFICLLLPVLILNCKSLPPYQEGQSLLGVLIDREGFGKLGKVSENFMIINADTGVEHASNAWTMSGATRNNEPFSVAIVPAGRYRLSSISLGSSTYLCKDDCPTFKLESGKIYFAGGYSLSITTSFMKITHTFKAFEPTKNAAEIEEFREYIRKSEPRWLQGKTIEHAQIFAEDVFTRTRGTL